MFFVRRTFGIHKIEENHDSSVLLNFCLNLPNFAFGNISKKSK